MNQNRASNKYLFNQVVNCANCKYYEKYYCKLMMTMKNSFTHTSNARKSHRLCGPDGKYYESNHD